ncbi:MAG TPA: ribonuclease Z [Cryomorphaceae bacterium]|nr:ribonuclease Z [Cryomorphaceae bacterium]
MKFDVTILGCGSATPTLRHNPTAQLVNHDEHYFLLDCGEGAQLQLRRFKLKFQRINHIFITHLHGDHYFGLPGLLSTMHLLGRTTDIHIYCKADLQRAMDMQLKISGSWLRFNVIWHPLSFEGREVIFESSRLIIESFPLKHRIPACGFRISEKEKQRNIIPEMVKKYNIPIPRIRQIKAGADYKLEDGTVIENKALTKDPPKPKSYAYCTDTAYMPETAGNVENADLLYHEATFLDADSARAKETLHSTAADAARVAVEGKVGKLMLGHYSARYSEIQHFADEAQRIFPNTVLADEGLTVSV